MWVCCVPNDENHGIGRNHLRRPRGATFFRRTAVALGNITGGIREYATPRVWHGAQSEPNQHS
jgi:hypothetical protein